MTDVSDFMVNIGMESHARLVSEWGYFKNKAETTAEDLETVTTAYDALRRALYQLLDVRPGSTVTDGELMTRLGTELVKAQGRLPVLRQLVTSEIPVGDYKILSPDESSRTDPWTPPTPDVPVRDHLDDQVSYAKLLAEADGTDETTPEGDDGPPTASMAPVEQPPDTPAGYSLGRMFHRGDPCPGQESLDLVMNRSGDVMRVFTEGMPEGSGQLLHQDGHEVEWPTQLHMNGTLWELVHDGEQVSDGE